ncbi:unnamed protein product [Sphagnum balticum]
MAEATNSAQEHASLEHVLAELALKEQVCKDLEKCQMTLRDQVQQLQLENKACKSGIKRENQWQLEREKLVFDLDSANLAAVEKDERIQQLERDLSGARRAVECVQTKCKEIERSKDKEINQKERLQAELEDARIAIKDLERDCKLKEEVLTKQRQAESDLFRKLETQKKLLQSHLSEAKRKAEEFDEMEMNFQIATQKLNDKEKQLNYLRDAHEKLCIANTGRQMQGHQEKETIINALEASQEKCEEQEEKLRKLEHDLGRAKNQMKQLEIRCKAAEAEVNTKSTSLIKVQLELETLAVSVAELAETKKQAEELVLKLKATENSLKQEMAARDLAELALKEYKKREEHLLMIEEGHSELQGKSKWRNEQFQSLEEAHSIIRTEFQESQRIWESERDSMVGEIDTLRENLQSKGKLMHDLHCRLDMLQQALAHEQSHRKVLELELVEARTGMGEAAADLERMHSAIENLKRETGEEIVLLKNNVSVKDRQIREMEIRQKEIEQEHEELQSMQLEFENFKRLNGELQQALGLKDKQILLLEEARNNDVGVAQARGLEWEEEKNLLIQSLTEAEASLSSKEARLKELSNELDAVRSSLECLRAAKLDFEQKHSEEKDNLLLILRQANETVAAREELVKELKTELTRLQVLIDHTQIAQVEAECQAKLLEQRLTEAHGEVKTTTEALELLTESGKAEKASLLEIIDGQNERIHEMKAAHDAQLVQTLEDLKNQDDQLMHIQTQYQDLQQLMNHREAKQRELQKVHEQQLWQLHSEERQWQEEKEKLIVELQHFEGQGMDQEKQLREQTAALERNKDVILKLEAHCHSLEQQVAEQTLLGELANGKMSIERAECMKLKKEVQRLNESFTAAIIAKDASLEQLRENITELQVGYQEHTNQTLRITTLVKRLEEERKMQANMEKHMLVLNAELDQSVLEVERLSAENGSLQASIHSLQNDSNVTKGVLESQLQTLEERLSVSNAELQKLEEISSQFGDAQTLISSLTGELQITSSTVEERDRSLLKLQSSLKTSQDQLQESRELIMAKENEREILAVKLTVAESRVEEMETQILSMQEALGIAESGLREETEKVLHHVAALKEAQLELVEWKEKAATATREASSSYLNGDANNEFRKRNSRGREEEEEEEEEESRSEFESRSRSSAVREKEGVHDNGKRPSSVTRSAHQQEMVDNVNSMSEREHKEDETQHKESSRSMDRMVAEAGEGGIIAMMQDANEMSGNDLTRRIVKDQLRVWEKERGKEARQEEEEEEEERARVKKQRVENGALLSLALPDTSLSLSSGDPHSHQSFPYQNFAQSYHPSQAQTHTHSSGFTNLMSLSHSQPFHHNPSCSLTQSSLDKMEMSSGSQQISQVKEQESRGSWQVSYGSNYANEGFLALPAQGKQRPKPLCQRLFQSGNDHHSLGSECLQQQKHWHNDEVRSSPSHGESSRDTQPQNLPSHVERIPSREKRLLERGAIGPETFTSIQVQDVVSELIPLMACKLQELPDSFLEGLKGSLRNMLNCIEKREQFVLLQKTLAARTDLITDTLLRAHRVQLELLVAVKTGIPAFLHPEIPMTHSALVEVFLQTKCRNFACQSQLPADECDCKLCAQKTGFCNSCMCVVCSKFDFDANTCRWIGCDFCLHWCHTDCGIRMGYISPGPSICGAAGTSEMQFHCIACDHTSELYGFVKDVFCNCAQQWSKDVLASELDCVRRIFHDSNDARGQQLCSKAEQMLRHLDAQVDLSLACSTVLKFFSGGIQSQAPSVSNKVQSQPSPVSNGVVKNPPASQKGHEASTRDALEQARTALQTYDAELEEKRKEGAELQQELEREKGQIEELERIIRIKQAEAKMFAVRADEAQREAEGLQCIVLAKAEKIEQEYASNMAKLHLEEAEDHCHKAHNTLQVLQQAQLDFHTLQLPLLSELCDLLKQLDATRLQSSK